MIAPTLTPSFRPSVLASVRSAVPARIAILAATAVVGTIGLASGCSGRPAATDKPDKPIVAVSVVPQAFAVRRVAGDLVDIEVMIPPGASPVTYEPSIVQLETLSKAKIYFKVGHPDFPYERAWLDKLLSERRELVVVDSTEGLEYEDEDPHVWVSPRHMRKLADNVRGALVELLPADEAVLTANHQRFVAEIDALDSDLRSTLGAASGRRFFVFHPAWGYLAREYGLVQVAIEAHGKEPDVHALASMIDEAKRAGVAVIFVQPQFNPASAELVASEVGARIEAVDPLAAEWADNLRQVAKLFAANAVR